MKQSVEQDFEKIGVRAEVVMVPNANVRRLPAQTRPIEVNIWSDSAGSCFYITHRWGVQLSVADADAADRHLLLVADQRPQGAAAVVSRFLCGHDERAWFVAAIPETSEVASVQEAKDALKPQEVWGSMREFDVPMEDRDRRWTAGFVRQGEWFFLPRAMMEVDHAFVLRNEPIRRGAGKPHWCDFVYRIGGELVFVCDVYPNGLTSQEHDNLDAVERRRCRPWREMTRDAEVYARGCVMHPDHQTIVLPYWHKVVMNTETKAAAMEHVAFLD